jgi:hypothetical protein
MSETAEKADGESENVMMELLQNETQPNGEEAESVTVPLFRVDEPMNEFDVEPDLQIYFLRKY